NINLAGIFFHIDEDAYLKLQRYLEAIKRSFTDSQGRSEIIADIEARIAELFSERVVNDKQVVSIKQVDEVIAIMGQPEDYLVDDEIFEDDPKKHTSSKTTKKLYRDKDNSYIAGVAAGLGHYLGIDAVWVRLLWVLLTLGSGGTFIFIYILFWILVPEAVTTAEKLTMTGEPVNISNIEKKIKDGIENVTDTVKNVDYEKYGNKIKSNSKSFFDTLGDIFMFFLKLFAKFFGILLIISAAAGLFAVIVSAISLGSTSFVQPWWMDYPEALNMASIPIWVGSLLLFLCFGIPLFFLLYLGLKILIENLKSIGRIAKFTLLGLWLVSLIALISIGIKYAAEFSKEASVLQSEEFYLQPTDTLQVRMQAGKFGNNSDGMHNHDGFEIVYNENDQKTLLLKNVNLYFKTTTDTIASIEIEKQSRGKDYLAAKEFAQKIEYGYSLEGNTLLLDNYILTHPENKYHNQKVNITVYLPEGSFVNPNKNTRYFLEYHKDNVVHYNHTDHVLQIVKEDAMCLTCKQNSTRINIDINSDDARLKITNEAMNFEDDSLEIDLNENGIKAKNESIKVNITEQDGIQITTDKQ